MKAIEYLKNHCWKTTFLMCLILTLAFEYKPLEYSFAPLFNFHLPGSFNQKIYFYLTDLFACLVIGISLWEARKNLTQVFMAPSSLCLLGLFSMAVLSVVFSEFAFYGWQFFRLVNLGILVLLSIVLSSEFTFPDFSTLIKKLFAAILILSCYQSILAFAQYLSQAPVGVLGEVDFAALEEEASIFKIHSSQQWIFDVFKSLNLAAKGYIVRPYGSMPHPNILGGVLFIGSFTTLYFLSNLQSGWKRRGVSFAMILQVFAIFISYSRSATIAWIFTFSLWLFIHIKFSQSHMLKRQKLWFFTKVALGVCLCSVLFYQQNSIRGMFVEERPQEVLDQTSLFFKVNDRVENQAIAFRMVRENPLLGVGFENYMLRIKKYVDDGVYSQEKVIFPVHNIYLLLCVEMGIIATVFFVGYLALILLKAGLHSLKSMDQSILLSIFLGLLFIGFCDFYLVIFQQGRIFLFILPAILLRSVQAQKIQAVPNLQENVLV